MSPTPPPHFTCPLCGRTSYHPEDIRNLYCGACHLFFDHRPKRSDPSEREGDAHSGA